MQAGFYYRCLDRFVGYVKLRQLDCVGDGGCQEGGTGTTNVGQTKTPNESCCSEFGLVSIPRLKIDSNSRSSNLSLSNDNEDSNYLNKSSSTDSFSPGLYANAVAEAIEEYLEKVYRPTVVKLEEELVVEANSTSIEANGSKPQTSFLHYWAELSGPILVLERLNHLVDTIVKEKLKGGPLLDHVWNLSQNTHDETKTVFANVLAKYFELGFAFN